MEYNNETRHFSLHAEVRGRFEPKRRSNEDPAPSCCCFCAAFAVRAREGRPRQADRDRGQPHERRRRAAHEHLRGQRGADQGHACACSADRIVVRQDAEGFQYATATGKPVRFRQKPGPQGRRRRKAAGWTARRCASRSTTAAGKVELFENARVNRGGDEVTGNYILVDQRSEFFSVQRRARAPHGRVKAIIRAQGRRPSAEEMSPA